MSGNGTPQFTRDGNIASALITTGNANNEGSGTIGTGIFLACTGDANNGTWIDSVRFIPVATAATTTTATVGRVYISSISTGACSTTNTWLFAEVTLPAIAAANASAAAQYFDIPCGFRLPAGYAILVDTQASPAANTAWRATAIGGDY
jgi:hypothetical protein